jgi:flagellar biosynthesis GTPase FlhF
MSALWASVTDTEPSPVEEEAAPNGDAGRRPALRAVPRARPRMARMPFILVLIAVFGVGMTGLLMLNTTLQNQAFQASQLNRQATELAYTQADLESRIDLVAAPQELARKASALGLRPNPYPAFVTVPSGKVVGKPAPVSGNEVPTLVIKTPAELAAERAAAVTRAKALAERRVAEAKAKAAADKAKAAADKAKAAQKKIDDAAAAKQKAAEEKTAAAQKVAQQRAAAKKAAEQKAAAEKAAEKAEQAAKKKSNGGRG